MIHGHLSYTANSTTLTDTTQREREVHEAAVVRRREQRREVLALLRARWPAVFSAPVPLALGIEREIREGLGEARVPSAQLGRALH